MIGTVEVITKLTTDIHVLISGRVHIVFKHYITKYKYGKLCSNCRSSKSNFKEVDNGTGCTGLQG